MNKTRIILLLLLFFLVMIWLGWFRPKPIVQNSLGPAVCFEQACFQVEIADTPEERSQGLMFREHLPQDHGLLFIFDSEGIYSFWMKNTLIPLDMIWLDNDFRVVFIKEGAEPCPTPDGAGLGPADGLCELIRPTAKARYVLELNAGSVGKLGLNLGVQLVFD